MKYFLLLTTVVFLAGACTGREERIAKRSDFMHHLSSTDAKAAFVKNADNKSFWQKRFDLHDDTNSLMKLASIHSSSFRQFGTIEDLVISDSLYHMGSSRPGANRANALRGLASNAMARHEFWEAKRYLEQALKEGENKSRTLLLLSDVQLEIGNKDSAALVLAGFTNKSTFPWLIRQAKILDHNGDLDGAIGLMVKALDRARNNNELYCWTKSNLGDMYGHAGRISDAYQAYLDVLERDPGYYYALNGIAGLAFSHDLNTDDASEVILSLYKKTQSPAYLLRLAEIEDHLGHTERKGELLQRFIATVSHPSYGNMYNSQIALVLADERKNTAEAVRRAKEEVRMRPSAGSYELLSWALFQDGRPGEALEIVGNFVEGKTHEPVALFHMGLIYASTDPEKARSHLERAAQSNFELGPVKSKRIESVLNVL